MNTILFKINDEKKGIPNNGKTDLPDGATNILICDSSSYKGLMVVDLEWNDTELTNLEQLYLNKQKENLRLQYQTERDHALNDAEIELDGMVFQTRPRDKVNFEEGIATNEDEWVLKDNSLAPVTNEQLRQVLTLGRAQAKSIYKAWKDKLRTLQ